MADAWKPALPREGAKIRQDASGKLAVPDRPILPFIEGDGTGPDIWARLGARLRRRGRQGLRRPAQGRLVRGARRREGLQADGRLAARGHARRLPRVPGRHQGPAHHAGRRRHPQPQRRAAPDPRPLRVPAAGALVPGRADPGEAPAGRRHGDLPREHGGHLRRDRVGGGVARGAEAHRTSCRRRWASRRSASRRPRGIGIKPVSREGTERLVRAALDYALAARAQERDLRAQGQHHEVHGGRLPRLGLRAREARVRRARRSAGTTAAASPPAGPAAGQGLDRRHHAPAGADAARRVRRDRHHEPERRLPLRRAGRAGGRHRHRARREHQLRDRPRHLRGHPRHRAEVRRPGQGEPELGDPLGRDDVRPPRLGRGRAPDRERHLARHRAEARHLRLPPADGRRHAAQVLASSATPSSRTWTRAAERAARRPPDPWHDPRSP